MNLSEYFKGYADSHPSESIQNHNPPALAVAVVFCNYDAIDPPVKQYKAYKEKQKARNAERFIDWLKEEKVKGLHITGMVHAMKQDSAAGLGMRLLEELPEAKIEKHYESYRLFFGKEKIDLPQAVALNYYLFTLAFGSLKAASSMNKDRPRKLMVLMDRFSGPRPENKNPGEPLPATDGVKFLNYVFNQTKTWKDITESNSGNNIYIEYGNLNWWKKGEEWREGKSHPNFILCDWLAQSAMATKFKSEYVKSFNKSKHGKNAQEALEKLYSTFKSSFNLWSMEEGVLDHIVSSDSIFEIDLEAHEFIMSRTSLPRDIE